MTQENACKYRYQDNWFFLEFRHPASEVSDAKLAGFRESFQKAGLEFTSGRLRNGEMKFFTILPASREIVKLTFGPEILTASHRFSPLLNPSTPPRGFDWFLEVLEKGLHVAFSLQGFPLIYQQTYTIEKVFSHESIIDSRLFIGKKVIHLDEENFKVFGRIPEGASVQFVIPPKIHEDPSEIAVEIKTIRHTPKVVVVSCRRRFFTVTYSEKDIPLILDHARSTKSFTDEKGLAFVSQFL